MFILTPRGAPGSHPVSYKALGRRAVEFGKHKRFVILFHHFHPPYIIVVGNVTDNRLYALAKVDIVTSAAKEVRRNAIAVVMSLIHPAVAVVVEERPADQLDIRFLAIRL